MLELNLQYFADGPGGEKTEPATPKKLEDARKEGKVAKSKELGNGLALISLFLILKIAIGYIGNQMVLLFDYFYGMFAEYTTFWNGSISIGDFARLMLMAIFRTFMILWPFLLVAFVVAFVSEVMQVKWYPTTKTLTPKFDKISPGKGFKRMFSMQSVIELLKALLKILIIVYVAYATLKDEWQGLYRIYDMTLNRAIAYTGELVIDLGLRTSFTYMVLALADFAYNKWKFARDMRMTKQEVRDEHKNAEGDPQIKGKIRRRMQEISMRRMMQELPKADVVITNPTHYAVAIKYTPEEADAPIVIAKGEDFLAQRIKDVARQCDIEIVENKPLARMLYANVDLGQQIPPELYQAVAEVLAFVFKLKGKA